MNGRETLEYKGFEFDVWEQNGAWWAVMDDGQGGFAKTREEVIAMARWAIETNEDDDGEDGDDYYREDE